MDAGESREAQAAREVGRTEVSRGVALLLTAAFLAVVGGVAAVEVARDLGRPGSPWAELRAAPPRVWVAVFSEGVLAANRELRARITAFEDALEDGSIVTERVLPPVQLFLTRRLRAGNEQVVVGRRGWLYFRQSVDYLTAPGFLYGDRRARTGPLAVIADLHAQLAARGIGLVVVVTPVKAAVHPEGLTRAVREADLPLENPSFARFLDRLSEMEIPAYTPAARLAEARRRTRWPQFLYTDTHWTARAMEEAADDLAEFLKRHVPLPERDEVAYDGRPAWVEGRGDLVALLKLPAGRTPFPPESVPTRPVFGPDGEPWKPDPDADVLLLGDSFTNVYSQAELGWGAGAGFAEQLSHALRRPVDKLAVNAGGPSAVREQLARQIAAGVDRLAGKRLVVYQIAARELVAGDWKPVDLSPRAEDAPVLRQRPEQGVPARGFAVWESNRSGDWRIWMRRLEGSPPRQLSPDEPDRQHCCAHLSPSGRRVAYLSRGVPRDRYPGLEVPGDLRLLRVGDGAERTVATDARPYGWGNRAVVWRNDRELVYVGGDGRTVLLDVETGSSTALTDRPRRRLAWLVDATLTHAVSGAPAFSAYGARHRRVVEAERFPGCEPYFTHDGRFGFWVRGGGGPIHWIDLRSRATGVLLDKGDPRIPGAQRYLYFPMVSRDGRMFAFGASRGDHDHAFSNYDVFVAPLADDPTKLALAGRPLRLTAHPASDRYPDVHVEAIDRERWPPAVPVAADRSETVVPPVRPFEAQARLLACSRVPSLREISPYRDALIVCEWEVTASSATEPGKRLRLAHWALRDGERQSIASWTSGATAHLRVRPLEGAETEGYPVFDTLPPAPDLAVGFSDRP
jgi:alginate O-acetyltransferase complex protein AlgJ